MACAYLRGLGREIVEVNYTCRFGEMDIIARDGETLCFVEVRARAPGSLVSAGESVNGRKQEKLVRTAQSWLAEHQPDCPCRFDVMEIELTRGLARVSCLIEDAFRLSD